jgi:hypothetical protein
MSDLVKKPNRKAPPISPERLKKMWRSRYLLPGPGPGVVEELINEIYRITDLLEVCQQVRDDWHKQTDELLVEVQRLNGLCQQHLDDKSVMRDMMDPEGRFMEQTIVWICNWLWTHERIQGPKKTKKGWE